MTPRDDWTPEDGEPEGVPHSRVGLGPRARALGLDLAGIALLAVLFGPWIGIRLGLGVYGGQGPGAGGMMAGATAGATLIGLLWFASEAVWGATPGKRLLGLQVGAQDGTPAGPASAALRWALKCTPLLLSLLAVLLSLGAPAVGDWVEWIAKLSALAVGAGWLLAARPSAQALHDRLTHTAVYRREDLHTPD